MNSVNLIGRLTEVPERRQTESGTPVTSFSLAVERNYKDQNGEYPVDFIQIQAWRHTAEFVCKYFTKGQRIGISGQIQTRKFKDREGNNRTAVFVLAESVDFADAKKDTYGGQVSPPAEPSYEEVQQSFNDNDDDLPF